MSVLLKLRLRARAVVALSIVLLGLVAVPRAGADVIPASDAGFVTEAGGSAKGDGTVTSGATYNYSVGREVHYAMGALGGPLVAMNRNNYFVFDLSGVGGTILSASLELYAGVYESVDPTETFLIGAPADPGAALGDAMFLKGEHALGPSAFDSPFDPAIGVAMGLHGNLGGGPTPFGGAIISTGDDGSTLSIMLDAGGIAYLNSFLGGSVLIAGFVPTAIPPASPQQPFGLTGPDIPGGDPLTPTLTVTIPEPGTLALALLGTGALVTLRRRQSIR